MAVGEFIFFIFCFGWAATAMASTLTTQTRIVYVGNTAVKVIKYSHGHGKNFVHVHQNEKTAKRAALTYIKRHGGSLLTLVHSGERHIRFVLRHQRYEFDPNRIFSDKGIKTTLRSESHYSPAAAIEVKQLAKTILRLLPKGKIIAVHNNRDYSMANYFPGHEMAADVRAIQQRHAQTYRNFYLVTQKRSFVRLQRLRQNVVWQAHDVRDDGSLSVYLASRDYVNVEAAYSAYLEQLRMLRLA